MPNLATDPRTAQAYAAAVARGAADAQVGVPEVEGPSAAKVLETLAPQEAARWISWAYELRDGPTRWWVVSLTSQFRLVGVGVGGGPVASWAVPEGTWTVSIADTDCVLHIAGGVPPVAEEEQSVCSLHV